MKKISLLQGVTKNELEVMMNVKIDGIKRDMGILSDGLKVDLEPMMYFKMEGLKEGLTKLLQERIFSSDKELHENKDEDKRK